MSLAEFSRIGNNIDLAGRIVLGKDDEPIFSFGKHKGKRLRDIWRTERSFFDWMLQGAFPKNTKDVVLQYKYKYMQEDKERK